MRELKFRAWQKEYGMSKIFTLGEPIETGDAIIMQFTGLIDKNGKEIYEGDIVRYTFDNPDSTFATENGLKVRTGKIFWQEFRASFAIGSINANNDLFKYVRNGNRVEVIGNIYEQAGELIEGRKG